MVYFIYGNDLVKIRERFQALAVKFIEKENCVRVDLIADNFSEPSFNGFVKGESLFGQSFLVVLRGVFENQAFAGFLLASLKKCRESENIFIFLEESPDEECLLALKKHASGCWKFDLPMGQDKKQDAAKELFVLCDRLAFRKRHESWLLFQEAVLKGMPIEEIFWKILWQIKTLLIVKSGDKAEFKPYFYNKTKKASELFTSEDLCRYSADLINLYHDSRYGFSDLEIGLERFILKI